MQACMAELWDLILDLNEVIVVASNQSSCAAVSYL